MHMQPPPSLGLGHTVVEPFPSLRLQRWTSSAVPLLRSELPSSLKCPALGVSLPAAISIPKLLPQEAQTPSNLVRCPARSAIPHPKTCTKPRVVCPALLCCRLLCPSSFWCHFLLLSSNSLRKSASPVPPVFRSYPCFQTSKRSRGWVGGARGYLKLTGRGGWSGTAAEVGRQWARGGRSSPDAGQHSLFCSQSFSKPCSI